MTSFDERFATLRQLLLHHHEEEPPWQMLLDTLHAWPADGTRERAMAYALDLLQHWPLSARWMCGLQLENPCWPLVATVRGLNHDIESLPELVDHPHIASLDLHGCEGLTDPASLTGLIHIRALDLGGGRLGLGPGSRLPPLPRLQTLRLDHCASLISLEPLQTLRHLQTLSLRHCTRLSSLAGIERLSRLETLHLDYCATLADISQLVALPRLQTLSLSFCIALEDISPLEQLASLIRLDLDGCTAIADDPACVRLRFDHLETLRVRWWQNLSWAD